MTQYTSDKSGINSLRGFAHQIRVFSLYMLKLEKGESIGFETVDDVAINQSTIDSLSECCRSTITYVDNIVSIQVKFNTLSKEKAEKVVLNWMLLEASCDRVKNYILYSDPSYRNQAIMFTTTAEELFKKITLSKKKANSIEGKAKKQFATIESFAKVYESVKLKYSYCDNDIDNELLDQMSLIFRRVAINDYVFEQRIRELLNNITVEILKSIQDGKPFTMTYEERVKMEEAVCAQIRNDIIVPQYSNFTKTLNEEIYRSHIEQTREYKQLCACQLAEEQIHRNISWEQYYQNFRYLNIETVFRASINNIETTAYENFQEARDNLQFKGEDTPRNRLFKTVDSPNSHAPNDQIRKGVNIYLTREEETDNQISWEDDYNAENRLSN